MGIKEIEEFNEAAPVVGQTVFVAKYSNVSRGYATGDTSVITKVGRKYFEVKGVNNGMNPIKFFNDSKNANTEYSGSPKLYPSKEAFELELLINKTRAAVVNNMNGYNALAELDYEELKAIADILSKKYDLKI